MQLVRNAKSKLHTLFSSASPVGKQRVQPLKLYRSKDYPAFVCGVMFLGGFICVPLLLSFLIQLFYFDTLGWSILAGAVFVAVFRSNGTISLLRVTIALLLLGITLALLVHHPMYHHFLFSGLLSTLLLAGCGKFATILARAKRGKMNGSGFAVLGLGFAIFMWFVFGQLSGTPASLLSIFGTVFGIIAAVYGCKQAIQGLELDPRILKAIAFKRSWRAVSRKVKI
jgi:hypothetical protein